MLKHFESEKAISPIISAVLLVAFSIALAAIVGPWITDFTKNRGEDVGERGKEQVKCVYSSIGFDIDDIYYNLTGSASSSSVNITLTNSGSEEIYNPEISFRVNNKIYSYEPTSGTDFTSSNPLDGGSQALLVTNITDDISGTLENVRVVFKNCPNNAVRSCNLVTEECE